MHTYRVTRANGTTVEVDATLAQIHAWFGWAKSLNITRVR